jgi:flagellar biosynthetic protein FlhB
VAENEDRSSEDLTEEASPHRLEEYRQKGMVAQSRELTALLALLAAAISTYVISPSVGVDVMGMMREMFRADAAARMNFQADGVVGGTLSKVLRVILLAGAPVAVAGFVVGIVGSFAQVGSVFSTHPITPDLTKIDPLSGMKKIFSMRALIEGFRLILKLAAVAAVLYVLVKEEILLAPGRADIDFQGLLALHGERASRFFLWLFGVLTVFAGADFALQRWEFSKNVRMTKQEAKQEFKEREGDPQIKSRIRAVQREVARRRMMQAVRKADAIVTNPTHIAVAIQYDKENMAAPKVVAKGADHLAQKIKAVAAEAGIPLVENVPLARTLFKSVKIGQYVPRALYQSVAEVLAYVYKLRGRRSI